MSDADGAHRSRAKQAPYYAARPVIDNDPSFDSPNTVNEMNWRRASLFPRFHGVPGDAFDRGVDVRFAIFVKFIDLKGTLIFCGPRIEKEACLFNELLSVTREFNRWAQPRENS